MTFPYGSTATPLNGPSVLDADAALLWTGGWDSTFRLLQLLRETEATVRPIYALDAGRASTLHELRAMARIRAMLGLLVPGAAVRIRPTWLFTLDEIPVDPAITAALQGLRQRSHLGGQYAWLSAMARQLHLPYLELAIHRDDTAYRFLQAYLVECSGPGTGPSYTLVPEAPVELALFTPFQFPIIGWTKLEMGEWAKRNDLASVLAQTWFCHRPDRGQPCGRCNPCRHTVREGLAERLPRRARLRYRAHSALRWLSGR